jgi:site-specific DNA-cytosine methylase
MRVVSLFCGGGMAEEALRRASERTGIATEVVMAVDNWEPAARVRDANLPGVRTTVRSVKDMTREDLPPHDLVIGGPPCQPFSIAGKKLGTSDPRDCIPDFVRLRGETWLMENVTSRLLERMGGGWSEKFCASDFGDVTSRKRWFYSSHILRVIPTPGSKRIRDIRDYDEDARVIAKRSGCKAGHHGHYDVRGSAKLIGIVVRNGSPAPNDARLLLGDDVLPSMTGKPANCNENHATLRLGLRGNSASASAFNDDGVLGSLLANAFHANEASKLVGCRNPSILEMARAHSIPDSWDWAGTTKTQRGQIIANSWPISMGTAVLSAMLLALASEKTRAA